MTSTLIECWKLNENQKAAATKTPRKKTEAVVPLLRVLRILYYYFLIISCSFSFLSYIVSTFQVIMSSYRRVPQQEGSNVSVGTSDSLEGNVLRSRGERLQDKCIARELCNYVFLLDYCRV
jgi:hypothetical protein